MTTKLFPTQAQPNTLRAHQDNKADGTNSAWAAAALSTAQGTSLFNTSQATVAGPTNGIESLDSGVTLPREFLSDPLGAAVTISGTVTMNVWGLESNMANNAGPQVIIERVDSQGIIQSTILNSEQGVEFGTVAAVGNWTATPTSTNMLRGDRIRVRLLANDAGGTMAGAAGGVTITFGGTTPAANGDTWVQFNENLTFDTTDPTGSQLFLITTAASASINPDAGQTELEAWTSRGSGSTNSDTTESGSFTRVQTTDTAGGTPLEWFSRPLQAFTFAGLVKLNVRAKATSGASGVFAEVAVTDTNGTAATTLAGGATPTNPTTTDAAFTIYLDVADLSVTNGQRIRVRLFSCPNNAGTIGTGTLTISYAGTTGGAAGDTWVTIPQSVTEYVAVTAHSLVYEPRRVVRNSLLRR